MPNPQIWEVQVFPGATKLLGLAQDMAGQPVIADDIESITVDVYDWYTDAPIGSFLAPDASVITVSTALQPEPYNVAIDTDGATYFQGLKAARVVARVQPIAGDVYPLIWKCNVIPVPPPISSSS